MYKRIPITQERETIDSLFAARRWEELAQFDIHPLRTDAADTLDCGHYVLHALGFPATPALIEALQKLATSAQLKNGLVVYQSWGKQGMRVEHRGLYDGGRVRSKWGPHAPVLEHPLAMIPSCYGEYVSFCADKTIRETLQAARQLSLWGPDHY